MKDKILSDFAGNRSEIKRWFIANGAQASLVKFATKADFLQCVDHPSALNALVSARLGQTTPQPQPQPQPQPIKKQETPPMVDNSEAMKKLQDALALFTQPAAMDENKIREIVREMLPDRQVTIQIETLPPFDFEGRPAHGSLGLLIQLLNINEPPYLKGPAGSGKSTAAEMAAESFGLEFYHTGKVDSKYDLIGFKDANGNYQSSSLYTAYKDGGVFLWDEVDASAPDALTAFLNLIEGTSYEFPCGKVKRHPDFKPMAAGNTSMLGADQTYTGRARQDGAFKDRFTEIQWDYDQDMETALYGRIPAELVQGIRAKAAALNVRHVISPRSTRRLQKFLQIYPQDRAVELAVRNGLDQATWDKIKP